MTLKIKYSDFTQHTRSKTLSYFITDKALILETAKELLLQDKLENSVRLLGITLSNLNTKVKGATEDAEDLTAALDKALAGI